MIDTGQSGGVYEPGTFNAPRRYCLAVLVANEPGILARVVGLFSGRGYNIESLTVDEIDATAHFSRITIVTTASQATVDQIVTQLARLIPVREVVNLTEAGNFVETCIALVKLVCDVNHHDKAKDIARKYAARIADMTNHAVIFELASERDRIERFANELRAFGAVEVARTGTLAMGCGDAVLGDISGLAQRRPA